MDLVDDPTWTTLALQRGAHRGLSRLHRRRTGWRSHRYTQLALLAALTLLVVACGSPPPAVSAPELPAIADRSTPINQALTVSFTVTDADLPGLSLSARSSAQAVVADAGLNISGAGGARELRITPVTGVTGTTTITVTATNPAGRSAHASFQLTVSEDTPRKAASDAASGDWFGRSVAISGDYAIIGSPNDNADEGPNIRTGAAYIFHLVDGVWTQQAKLKASDGSSHDAFGTSVAISGDYAIIGAPEYTIWPTVRGAAYVFKRDGTQWTEQATLTVTPDDRSTGYAHAVAISGTTAVVGAWQINSAGDGAGAAYVYQRAEGAWTEQAKLIPADGAAFDRFGSAVAISSEHALVGSPDDDDVADRSGSAYVFARTGTDWSQQAKLTASDAGRWDRYGAAVGLSGTTALVGSGLDDDLGTDSGSAYVYRLQGDAWVEQEKLTDPGLSSEDWFGHAVAISDEFYLVGAPGDNGVGFYSGASYFLRRTP